MSTSALKLARSKSAFDISTLAIDDFIPPGHIPEKRQQCLLPEEENLHNTQRRASDLPIAKPPMPPQQGVRRQSFFDKAINGTLKNDLKNLWARRSSLTIFKPRSSHSPASDEESLKSSAEESIEDLMKEVGGFFMVDKSAWSPPPLPHPVTVPPKRRSFSLFGRNKNN